MSPRTTLVALAAAAGLLAPAALRAQDQSAYGRAVQLGTAIMTNDTLQVQRILATGLDVDTPRSDDGTALMSAAAWGRLDLARLLLARGADPLLENKSGETARDLALRNGHRDLARLLEAAERKQPLPDLRANTSGRSNYEVAVELRTNAGLLGDRAKVEALLATGVDVDFPTGGDWTALQAAAARGNVAIVELLLAKGADPSRRNANGRTARDEALANGHADAAAVLAKAMGIAEPARRRRAAPTDAPANAPTNAPTNAPATPAPAKSPAPAPPPTPAPTPAATKSGPNETLPPEEYAPTGVKPRAGLWHGTVTNQGAGKWTVSFRVAPNGDITEFAFDGDIRCTSGGSVVGTGSEYGRSRATGMITRDGARFVYQNGAVNGTYVDEKARVHWRVQGHFTAPGAAAGSVRIGAGAGACDTWGLKWTAKAG